MLPLIIRKGNSSTSHKTVFYYSPFPSVVVAYLPLAPATLWS